jgi:hypothetical protein
VPATSSTRADPRQIPVEGALTAHPTTGPGHGDVRGLHRPGHRRGQYIRTIHPALAEGFARFEENVAADGLQLNSEQPDRLNNLPAAAGNHH